jgi:hypothetical protein
MYGEILWVSLLYCIAYFCGLRIICRNDAASLNIEELGNCNAGDYEET